MQSLERKLGMIEAYFAYAHKIAGTFLIRAMFLVAGPVSPEAVRAAFRALRHRHPFLDVRIVDSPHGLYFVPDNKTTEDPLEIHALDVRHDPGRIYEAAGALHFNEESLLYKFIFIMDTIHNENVLIAVFHHSISDAMSVISLCREFVQYVDDYMTHHSVTPRLSHPTPPSLESLLVKRQQRWRFFRRIASYALWRLHCDFLGHEYPRHNLAKQTASRSIVVWLDDDQTKDIDNVLKNQKYGVNTILGAGLLLAKARFLASNKKQPRSMRLLITTPINCRSLLAERRNEEYDCLCCRACVMVNSVKVSAIESAFDVASRMKSGSSASPMTNPESSAFGWYSSRILEKTIRSNCEETNKFVSGIIVTYLGEVQPTKFSRLTTTMIGIDLTVKEGAALLDLMAYRVEGRLRISVSYGAPFLSDASADRLVELFMDALPVVGRPSRGRGPWDMV